MHRRNFIKSMTAAGAIAAIGRRAHALEKGWREFEIDHAFSPDTGPLRLILPAPLLRLGRPN